MPTAGGAQERLIFRAGTIDLRRARRSIPSKNETAYRLTGDGRGHWRQADVRPDARPYFFQLRTRGLRRSDARVRHVRAVRMVPDLRDVLHRPDSDLLPG